jgi:hypothetical protein
MPLLMISYLLQFLDKQTLNFASVMGMIQDLVSLPLPTFLCAFEH